VLSSHLLVDFGTNWPWSFRIIERQGIGLLSFSLKHSRSWDNPCLVLITICKAICFCRQVLPIMYFTVLFTQFKIDFYKKYSVLTLNFSGIPTSIWTTFCGTFGVSSNLGVRYSGGYGVCATLCIVHYAQHIFLFTCMNSVVSILQSQNSLGNIHVLRNHF
jgi:hypothetical protein